MSTARCATWSAITASSLTGYVPATRPAYATSYPSMEPVTSAASRSASAMEEKPAFVSADVKLTHWVRFQSALTGENGWRGTLVCDDYSGPGPLLAFLPPAGRWARSVDFAIDTTLAMVIR